MCIEDRKGRQESKCGAWKQSHCDREKCLHKKSPSGIVDWYCIFLYQIFLVSILSYLFLISQCPLKAVINNIPHCAKTHWAKDQIIATKICYFDDILTNCFGGIFT